ncbi:MAG: bifunctional hydroxymethylpyrimidine kinase/phosphomethylpyrimidine kinase [Rhodospirillales bacterium]|nr:bifunctional hydroxymethylpyrimidine kinase/phosphomethylpyrimidine kinase [Rhodospirillales bacterium]MBO6787492.1 bifunctional hydroxymethylpyrimidine kinase/phosphomethylpyrimidine kinase [Rhodospirillales bacterium]
MKGRVLIVAGSDSGGGAGIQADIKAVTALGGFAMTAITALTAQNTQGVHGIHDVPVDFVAEQMRVVLDDLGADCIKIGMLHRPEIIEKVVDVLADLAPGVPVVADPVMVAKGGASLLADAAQDALKSRLLPAATLVTPNIPEAEVLTGLTVGDVSGMQAVADALLALGPDAVLLKGGHLDGTDTLTDLLVTATGSEAFETERLDTPNTHGTGCTLASAIACGIAQGLSLGDAVRRGQAYVHEAIRTNPGFGSGHGPLNHAYTVGEFKP